MFETVKVKRLGVIFPLILTVLQLLLSGAAYGGNGANFVLYNHHTADTGELEVMFMTDIGQEPDGTRYTSQMVEFEVGVTDRWTSEFMIEGQVTSGEGGYNFTGFRWENRYRPFEYGTFLNPVFYMEYESLAEDTKYLMEVSGREDAAEREKARPRERVLETRLILGRDITPRLDMAVNWLNESDLDTGVTSFGYAAGLNYRLFGRGPAGHARDVVFGLELFGGLGDSDKGITADPGVTQHYLSPNLMIRLSGDLTVRFGGAIGLTDVSQDLARFALGYEF
ncbi:MAG: hypothetical protein GXO94_09465 [Nitrospirae bacterium]|nr:hypothetical protein [Nitrospirota bacterium]